MKLMIIKWILMILMKLIMNDNKVKEMSVMI